MIARLAARPDTDPTPIRHPAVLCLFAAAMGILEAIVVVYLRRIYYPDGFGFPLTVMDAEVLRIEIIREAMTLMMLATVAWLAAGGAWPRLMAFVIAFGVWDILYYVGLKLFLDWPVSLVTPDILFLIPTVWVGPVLAPALVAALWVVAGLLLHRHRYRDLGLGWKGWLAACAGCGLILASFLIHAGTHEAPGFLWGVYAAGYAIWVATLVVVLVNVRRSTTSGPPRSTCRTSRGSLGWQA